MKKETNSAVEKAEKIANGKTEEVSVKKEVQTEFEKNDGNGKNKASFKGWLAAVISLGIISLILASVLTFTLVMPTESGINLENSYQRSFYDAMSQIDNMDLNLSKSLNSKDRVSLNTYLTNLAVNSELAESDIQQLPLKDENKFYTSKLINQIGDYAKYLNKKLAAGENLSQEDYAALRELYAANLSLKNSMQNAAKGMNEDFSFTDNAEDENGVIVTNLTELENLSVEFPELIYDGPFSDGKDVREIKGLSGENITEAEAVDIFNGIFAEYRLNDVTVNGTTKDGIECYNVTGIRDGDILYAQISVTGGKLIMFSFSGSCNAVNYESSAAERKSLKFLEDLGFENMKAVWTNRSNNVYTFNLTSEKENVTVYPDMVKVRICAETCEVIGLEATSYFYNHYERDISEPTISEDTAKTYVSENINIQSARLCIIPVGNSSEKLCYEFSGESEDGFYYVYINAETGKQEQLFKVIESTEGTLLI